MSAGTLLNEITRTDDHVALVDPVAGEAVTYAQLHERVDHLARQLTAAGVGAGDVVAMSLANGPPFVVAFLGAIATGAAAAPLNPAYLEAELHGYLIDLRPRAVIVDTTATEPVRAAARALGLPPHVLEGSALRGIAPAPGYEPADADSPALLLHTSGTTSRPKCVPLRQRNLVRAVRTVAGTYGLGEADVSHCVMPLFHVHGLVASTLATLAGGGTVVIPPRFSAGAFWAEGSDHGATWYSAVPTIHQVLLARARETAATPSHDLRFARSCSSPLPEAVWSEFETRFEVPLVEAYGMTEASHQMASNPLPPGERRPRTVGRPTGVELAILDDEWRSCPDGEAGEVAIRGPSVVDGYRDNPDANAASFRYGWFRTGDRGRLSPDGYLELDGRIKELINRGGEKISPHEVEEALLAHPAVAEAVAFAAPDAKYGEQVGAAVVVRAAAGERELTAHCADRLAHFKVPAFISIVDTIPKGPTGKIQRRLLADQVRR